MHLGHELNRPIKHLHSSSTDSSESTHRIRTIDIQASETVNSVNSFNSVNSVNSVSNLIEIGVTILDNINKNAKAYC